MTELRFRAMGTDAHVIVPGSDPRHVERARARIADLEMRWSRFIPESEVSRLIDRAGSPVVVSDETFDLVARAVDAWRITGGRFDPTMLRALVAAGYDRDFALVSRATSRLEPSPASGCAGIELDEVARAVTLPAGVAFDPGGIGKGLAADLVCEEILDAGAACALVSLGGDLRARGSSPDGEGWRIDVADPSGGAPVTTIVLDDGAVATTSRARRRWTGPEGERHHVLDPRTGMPARTPVVSATVVAGEAWLAEALAKAAFLDPDGVEPVLDAYGAGALVVTEAGDVRRSGSMEGFEA